MHSASMAAPKPSCSHLTSLPNRRSRITTTAGSATYVGTRQSDRWGSLQVTVTVNNGKITNVTYTSTAGDGKSRSIEARATPTLKSEVVAANSAQVSSVSGATYTSAKYLTSLQSALDQIR